MLKKAEKKQIIINPSNWSWPTNENIQDKSSWFRRNKIIVILWSIILFIIIISSISWNSSTNTKPSSKDYCPNGDYSSSYYDDDCWLKPDEKICRWSDWRYYDKPKNAYCDWSKTPQWWSCNRWFSAKSQWNRTRDHNSWYCECNSSHVTCSSYYDTQTDIMQAEINEQQSYLNNMYVNQYSQSSVNKYNAQVQYVNDLIWRRNRYMSENCTCSSY